LAAAYRLSSPFEKSPPARRASGLALAVGINLLLLFALIGMSRFAPMAQKASRTIIVDLLPESRPSAEEQARSEPLETTAQQEVQQAPAVKPPPIALPVPPTIAPPPPRPPAEKPLPWIELSRADMAAGNIQNLPKGGSSGAGDSEEVGRGPNGEVLYAAEWARRPTDAELGGYLPRNAPEGWGLIACRTIPGNRVDDCIELGQSPAGSRLASAVRQAAWQFRVRPPRKNGKAMVGEWVRIRIDYQRSGG
jgi:protein TonB